MGSIDHTSTNDHVGINAGKVYAATHFFGDDSRNIDQRRYMPFDDELDLDKRISEEIIEDIGDFIMGD